MDIMGMIQQLLGQKQQPMAGIKSPLPQNQNPGGYNSPLQPGLNSYYQREAQANSITPQQGMAGIKQYPQQQVMGASAPTPTPTIAPLPKHVSPTAVPTVDPSFINFLNTNILPTTRQYGIPDALVAAQAGQESGYGKKLAGRHNYFGLKAHSYPGFANFDTPEAGATYYAQTVQALVPNYKSMKNPSEILKGLQGHGKTGNYEGDNPNPMQYVYDVSQNPLWKAYGGDDLNMQNPRGWK